MAGSPDRSCGRSPGGPVSRPGWCGTPPRDRPPQHPRRQRRDGRRHPGRPATRSRRDPLRRDVPDEGVDRETGRLRPPRFDDVCERQVRDRLARKGAVASQPLRELDADHARTADHQDPHAMTLEQRRGAGVRALTKLLAARGDSNTWGYIPPARHRVSQAVFVAPTPLARGLMRNRHGTAVVIRHDITLCDCSGDTAKSATAEVSVS